MNNHGKGDRRNNWLIKQTFYSNNNSLLLIDGIYDYDESTLSTLDKWFIYGQAEFSRPTKSYKFDSVSIITNKDLNILDGNGVCKFEIYGKNGNNWTFLHSFKVGANPTNSHEYASQNQIDNDFIKITKNFNNSNFYYSYMLKNIEVSGDYIDGDGSLCNLPILEIEWGNHVSSYNFHEANNVFNIGSETNLRYVTNSTNCNSLKHADQIGNVELEPNDMLIKLNLKDSNTILNIPIDTTINYKLNEDIFTPITNHTIENNEITFSIPISDYYTENITLKIATPNLELDPYNTEKWNEYSIKPPLWEFTNIISYSSIYTFPTIKLIDSPIPIIPKIDKEAKKVILYMKYTDSIANLTIEGKVYEKNDDDTGWTALSSSKVECAELANDTVCLEFTINKDEDHYGYFILKAGDDYCRHEKWVLTKDNHIYTYASPDAANFPKIFINQNESYKLIFSLDLYDLYSSSSDLLPATITSIKWPGVNGEEVELLGTENVYNQGTVTINIPPSRSAIAKDINFDVVVNVTNKHDNNITYTLDYVILADKQIDPYRIMSNINFTNEVYKLKYWVIPAVSRITGGPPEFINKLEFHDNDNDNFFSTKFIIKHIDIKQKDADSDSFLPISPGPIFSKYNNKIIVDKLSITSNEKITITMTADSDQSFQVYIDTDAIEKLDFNPEITNSATSYLLQYSPNYNLPNTITIKDPVFSNFKSDDITIIITQNIDNDTIRNISDNDNYQTYQPKSDFEFELIDDTITIEHLLLYDDITTVTFTIELKKKNDSKYNDYSFVFDILGTEIEEIRFNPQITNPDTNTYPSPNPKLLYRNESDNPFENTLIIEETIIFIDVNKHVNVDINIEGTNTRYSLVITDYKITIPSIVILNKDNSVIIKIYYDNTEYDITILPEDIEIVSPNHIFSTFKLPPIINDNWTSKTLDSDGNEAPPKKIFESLTLSPNKQEIIWDNNMNLSPTNFPNVDVGIAINHIFSSDSTVIISYDQGDDKEFGLVIGKTIDIDDFVGTATNFELYSSTYSGWNSIIQYHKDTDNRNENIKYLYAWMGRPGYNGGIDLYDDNESSLYAVQPPSAYSNQNKANSEGWLGSNGGFGDYRHHMFDIKEKHIKQYVKFERKDGQMRINYSNELSSGYKENDYVTKMGVINPEEEEYLVMMKFNLRRESLPITQWPKIEKIPSLRNVIYDLHPESQRYVNRSLIEADKQNISFNLVGSFKSWSLSKEVSFDIKNFVGDNAKKNKTFFKVYMTVNDNTTEQIVSANFFHKDITNQTDRNLMKQGFNIPDEDLDLQYIVVDSNEQEISDGLLEVLRIKQHYNGNLFPTINGKCTLKRIDIYNSIVIDASGEYVIKLNQKESYIQPLLGFLITPVYSTYPPTTNNGSLEEPDSSTHNIALNEWKPHPTGGDGGVNRATVINYIFRSDYCIITSFKNKDIIAGIIYKRGLSLAPDIYTGFTTAPTGVVPASQGYTGFKNNYLVRPSPGYFDPHRIYGGILNNSDNHIFIKFERIGNYTAIYTSDKNSELIGPNDDSWQLAEVGDSKVSNRKTLGIESCIQVGIKNTPSNSVDPTNLKIIYASFVPFNPIISNSDEVAISYTGNNKVKLLYGNNFENSLKIEDKNLFYEDNKEVIVTIDVINEEGDYLINALHTVNVSDGTIIIPSIILNDNSMVRLNIEYNGTNFAINIPEDEIVALYLPSLNNVDASENDTKLLVGGDYENTITIQEVNYFVVNDVIPVTLEGADLGNTVTSRELTVDNDKKIIIDKIILNSKSKVTINIVYNGSTFSLDISTKNIKDLNNVEAGLVIPNTNFSGGITPNDGVQLETEKSEMFGWTDYKNVWKIKSGSQSWAGSNTPSINGVQNEYLIGLHNNNDTLGNECSISTKYYNTISGDSYVLSWWQQNNIIVTLSLIASHDFSSDPLPTDKIAVTGTELIGWNIPELTPTNKIRIIKSGRTSGSYESVRSPIIDGVQSEYFIILHSGPAPDSGGERKVSKVIDDLIVGFRYRISWYERLRAGAGYADQERELGVFIDDIPLNEGFSSLTTTWVKKSGDFEATQTSMTLTFSARPPTNLANLEDAGVFISDINIYSIINNSRQIGISLGDTLIAPYKTISNTVAGEWEERIISFKASDTSSTIKFTSRGILGLPSSIGTAYISNVKFEKNSVSSFITPTSISISDKDPSLVTVQDEIKVTFHSTETILQSIPLSVSLYINDRSSERNINSSDKIVISENNIEITFSVQNVALHNGILTLQYGSSYGSEKDKPIESIYDFDNLIAISEINPFPLGDPQIINEDNIIPGSSYRIRVRFTKNIYSGLIGTIIVNDTVNSSSSINGEIENKDFIFSYKVTRKSNHTGILKFIYAGFTPFYTNEINLIDESAITPYSYPDSIEYNGSVNNYGSGLHLKPVSDSTLKLTFTGGMLHSDDYDLQVDSIKYKTGSNGSLVQVSKSDVISISLTENMITLNKINPTSLDDVYFYVKLIGPDGSVPIDDNAPGYISFVVPMSQLKFLLRESSMSQYLVYENNVSYWDIIPLDENNRMILDNNNYNNSVGAIKLQSGTMNGFNKNLGLYLNCLETPQNQCTLEINSLGLGKFARMVDGSPNHLSDMVPADSTMNLDTENRVSYEDWNAKRSTIFYTEYGLDTNIHNYYILATYVVDYKGNDQTNSRFLRLPFGWASISGGGINYLGGNNPQYGVQDHRIGIPLTGSMFRPQLDYLEIINNGMIVISFQFRVGANTNSEFGISYYVSTTSTAHYGKMKSTKSSESLPADYKTLHDKVLGRSGGDGGNIQAGWGPGGSGQTMVDFAAHSIHAKTSEFTLDEMHIVNLSFSNYFQLTPIQSYEGIISIKDKDWHNGDAKIYIWDLEHPQVAEYMMPYNFDRTGNMRYHIPATEDRMPIIQINISHYGPGGHVKNLGLRTHQNNEGGTWRVTILPNNHEIWSRKHDKQLVYDYLFSLKDDTSKTFYVGNIHNTYSDKGNNVFNNNLRPIQGEYLYLWRQSSGHPNGVGDGGYLEDMYIDVWRGPT